MAYVLVRHKVEDYNKWKTVYDGHENTRKKSGCKGARLFNVKDNSNEVVALFEWDSIENAKKFAGSQDLKETMQKAGVSDIPDVFFLEQIQKTNA
jgi:quinol monooxygenase YgiN